MSVVLSGWLIVWLTTSTIMWVRTKLAGTGRYATVLPHFSVTLWGFNPQTFIFNRADWAICPLNKKTSSSQQQHHQPQHLAGQYRGIDTPPQFTYMQAQMVTTVLPCFLTLYMTTTTTHTLHHTVTLVCGSQTRHQTIMYSRQRPCLLAVA